jgi:DNA-binding transcriptional LysR family regulator
MLAWAERILSLHQHAEHAVSKSSGHQGIVRVGVSETIVHTWLPAFVQAVEEAYPRLSLELTVDITPRLRDEIVAQELDLAFLLGPISDPTMHNLPLSRYPLSFMAAPRLGLSGRTISFEKLAEFALITYPRRTKPTIALREIFRLHDTRQPRLFASASLSANIRLAVDGVGVAMLPPSLVRAELSSKRLEIVSTEVELEALEFTITHSKILTSPIIAGIAEIARSVALAAEE